MSSIASERLREMLNWWKWICLAREVASPRQLYRHTGDPERYLRRWRKFERVVLDNSIEQLHPRDWFERRGALPEEEPHSVYWRLRAVESFPCELFSWNRTSRRAFHIPENLQCLFISGDYSKWKWEDLLWPYESVILTLEHPLDVEDEPGIWSHYDAILVAHVVHPGRGKVLVMRMLRRPHGPRPDVFPSHELQRVDKHLVAKKRDRAMTVVSHIEDSLIIDQEIPQGSHAGPLYATFDPDLYPTLQDFIRIEPDDLAAKKILIPCRSDDEQHWKMRVNSFALKIVVGWCAYMGHLHSNAYETVRNPTERGTRGITGVITTPEHICTMLTKARLDPGRYYETKELEVPTGMFKRPHWRRGHWKKEAGAGPNAPRTIRVPPMLIRWDLVPIFGIISGTETYIDDTDEW